MARVVPPPPKAVRDQLRGVQQIHPTKGWLGYGSPYPPLRVPGILRNQKPKPKPSVAPSLCRPKALQDEDKPSCQQGGWNEEDWKEWKTSSDWTWNSWNYKDNWIQNERYHEKDIDEIQKAKSWDYDYDYADAQHAQSWEQEISNAYVEMELDLVSGKDEFEEIQVEEEDHHEQVIKRSREILQRHRREEVRKSGKRGRSHFVQKKPCLPLKKSRRRRSGGGKSSRKQAKSKAINAKRDDKHELTKVEISELRFSQATCSYRFRCGRTVSQLVQRLLRGEVTLSAPFLRLTVFETTDETTNEPILRCIDNRRLLALKEYAKRSGKERLMVNVELYSNHTLKQVQRFIQNSDDTDGSTVWVRNGKTTT